jgi:hypothetical protein
MEDMNVSVNFIVVITQDGVLPSYWHAYLVLNGREGRAAGELRSSFREADKSGSPRL